MLQISSLQSAAARARAETVRALNSSKGCMTGNQRLDIGTSLSFHSDFCETAKCRVVTDRPSGRSCGREHVARVVENGPDFPKGKRRVQPAKPPSNMQIGGGLRDASTGKPHVLYIFFYPFANQNASSFPKLNPCQKQDRASFYFGKIW